MALLQLQAHPTFATKVAIPVHGSAAVDVDFVFKHMTTAQYEAFFRSDEAKSRSDVDALMGIVEAWPGVDAPFNRDNVQTFTEHYQGAVRAIVEKYVTELVQVRVKN